MVGDRASTRFVGDFWFAKKNGRWSMVDDRASGAWWEGLVRKGNQLSSIIDR
jgi:hypothetical protein